MTHTVKTWPSAIYNGLLQIPAKSRDIPPFQGTKHQAEQWTHWKLKINFVFSLLCQWEAIWEKCLAEKYIWSGEPAPLWSRFSIIKMMEWSILVLNYTKVGQIMLDIIILGPKISQVPQLPWMSLPDCPKIYFLFYSDTYFVLWTTPWYGSYSAWELHHTVLLESNKLPK